MLRGIDWEGDTKIEGVAMEADGTEILRVRKATSRHNYSGCIQTIQAVANQLETETSRRGSIGIPRSLEPVNQLDKGASSTWLLGRPVAKDFAKALGRAIRVGNDEDCFASSEAFEAAEKGYNVIFVEIQGSNAGIAVGCMAHHGPNNSSGECGHNPLPFSDTTEPLGSPCYCGRHGCMETWICGRAFETDSPKHTGEELSARNIILKWEGDRLAGMLWKHYIDPVSRGIAQVVNTLDPDILTMGGGISNVDARCDDLPKELTKRIFSTVFNTPIVRAKHGNSSEVREAA